MVEVDALMAAPDRVADSGRIDHDGLAGGVDGLPRCRETQHCDEEHSSQHKVIKNQLSIKVIDWVVKT